MTKKSDNERTLKLYKRMQRVKETSKMSRYFPPKRNMGTCELPTEATNSVTAAAGLNSMKLQEQTTWITPSSSLPEPMIITYEPSPTATNSVSAAAGLNSMKLQQQQTTRIIPSSSLPEPIIITSEPSSTATNSGSSHQMTAAEKAEKAEDEFLASIVIPEPVHFKEITEDDVIKMGLFVTPGEVRVSKGRTMTQMLRDTVEELCAKYPLPPDYDSDKEWGACEVECCGGINHWANEQTDMQDWFRELMASSAPPKR